MLGSLCIQDPTEKKPDDFYGVYLLVGKLLARLIMLLYIHSVSHLISFSHLLRIVRYLLKAG